MHTSAKRKPSNRCKCDSNPNMSIRINTSRARNRLFSQQNITRAITEKPNVWFTGPSIWGIFDEDFRRQTLMHLPWSFATKRRPEIRESMFVSFDTPKCQAPIRHTMNRTPVDRYDIARSLWWCYQGRARAAQILNNQWKTSVWCTVREHCFHTDTDMGTGSNLRRVVTHAIQRLKTNALRELQTPDVLMALRQAYWSPLWKR